MEFYLTFSDTGLRADPEYFMLLEDARDAAFDLSLETQSEVSILQGFGRHYKVVERVLA